MLKIFVMALLVWLTACGHDGKGSFGTAVPTPDRQLEMRAEDRSALLPNDLFTAVYNNQADQVAALAKSRPALMGSANRDGDTPLGLALSLGYRRTSQVLIQATTPPELLHLNAKGESYVYLASRAGFAEAITWLGDLLASSKGFLQIPRFVEVDQDNQEGQTALFAAADRQTAQALEAQYSRDLWGVVKFPLWDFLLKLDPRGQNFLHAASASGRADLIDWAATRLCAPNGFAQNENPWIGVPGKILDFGWHAVETYTPEQSLVGFPTSQLFNRPNDQAKTPLHLAVENHQWAAMRALAGCQWLDYDVADQNGDLPLASFVAKQNPKVRVTDADAHAAFAFLLAQNTQMREIFSNPTARINHANNDGDTAMHLAAALADPYYYDLMAQTGDTRQPNKQGLSAEAIFTRRQAEVRQNGE